MIDTHTHLYCEEFLTDGGDGCRQAVSRALAAGVSHLVFPNIDAGSVAPMLSLHSAFPDCTSVAMGLHPTEVRADWQERLDEMAIRLDGGGYCAVGEVGIDLYWDTSYRSEQCRAFTAQLRWGVERSLPVIIHCREGLDDTLHCISEAGAGDATLVFHSFTGSADDVARIREVAPDAFFGINGVVTFKSAAPLREALPPIGLDRILLETDSPYLAPTPHRGERNESAYIVEVCRRVAAALGEDYAAVERATDCNAAKVFGIT